MKTIGLLGGMSWESTELYYRLINEETKRQLGGLHSAPIAMVSVDFDKLEKLQHADDWSAMAEMLSKRARQVEVAGADILPMPRPVESSMPEFVLSACWVRDSRWNMISIKTYCGSMV